jgi:hypothetical protein
LIREYLMRKKAVIGGRRTELLACGMNKKARVLEKFPKKRPELLIEAKALYEEVYNSLVETFYPDHPIVLRSANKLVEVLISTKEYYDAERYARVCYECLTRPIDLEDNAVSLAAESLEKVTLSLIRQNGEKGGDINEVESLLRKSLCIKNKIFGHNHCETGETLASLSDLLAYKGNHDDEVKDL